MKYRIHAAVLAGAVMELVLYGPLLLLDYVRVSTERWQPWLEQLSFFQLPSATVIDRLLRTEGLRQFAVHHQAARGIMLAAKASLFLMQATIFACAALGIIYLLRLRQRPLSLRPQFVAAILGPPLFLLLLTSVVLLPNYVLSEEEAKIAMMLSAAWLAAAALLLAMAYLAKLTNGRLLS